MKLRNQACAFALATVVLSCGERAGNDKSDMNARARQSGKSADVYGNTFGLKDDLSDLGVPGLLWQAIAHHRDTGAKASGASLACTDDGSTDSFRQTCMLEETGSHVDHVQCTTSNFMRDGATEFDRAEFDSRCAITSSQWPRLSPKVSGVLAQALSVKLKGAAEGFEVGKIKKLKCAKPAGVWACEVSGFAADEVSAFEFVAPYVAPKLPKVKIAKGTRDVDGTELPVNPAEVTLSLPSGAIRPQTYAASDAEVAEYIAGVAPESVKDAEDHIDDIGYEGKCRLAEVHALLDYTAEGYRPVNKALRTLGQPGAEAIDRKLELAVRMTISGVNCMKRAKRDFVVRGATLKPEAIARYVVGGFVTERALTSTSMADEVVFDFKGNVEFRVIQATGANLDEMSYMGEEGEDEMLIQSGTIFKVISNEVDGGVTVIELQQVR